MLIFLDIFTALTLILSIYLCGVNAKVGWFIYTLNAIPYMILMLVNDLYFMTVVGFLLFLIGVKNFVKEIRR